MVQAGPPSPSAVPWVVLHGTLGRRHPTAAPAAGLVFSVWFTWFLVTWLGMADSSPAPLCPGNVPLVAELHPYLAVRPDRCARVYRWPAHEQSHTGRNVRFRR